MGTFDRRMRELAQMVGGGNLRGNVRVNQAYAQDQHETLYYKHPFGGEAKYLTNGLMEEYPTALQSIARDLLAVGPRPAMIDFVEALSHQVYVRAPVEFADLKASGHPRVFDGHPLIYDRPPNQRRLTNAENDAKSDLREMGFGNRRAIY
jgi:hypothetical protein